MTKNLNFFNTLSNKKEKFVPINSNKVGMYVCGPTVYDFPHIGNARPLVVFDVLFRTLKKIYGKNKVTYVRNITDIDDKIIESSKKNKKSVKELTETIAKSFHEDCKYLNCLSPTYEPKATEYIREMISMVTNLLKNKHAYENEKHVYFSVSSFKKYGKLSNKNSEQLVSGSRVEVSKYKKDPLDFVLWKPSEENDPGWDSPWGRGRPGWHLECSVMSEKFLGKQFDIHGGGLDLVFPHHENEIAQSCCANKSEKFANYWLHNGFVTFDKEKMSKSKGNILDPLEVIKIYGLDQLRYYLVKEVSFGNDGNISNENIENCINSDLANNYGNFCQRTFSFAEKNCKSVVPSDIDFNSEDLKILNSFSNNINKIRSFMDNQQLNEYVKFIVDKSFDANKYFNDEAPWNKKDDKRRLNTIVYVSLEIIRKISILLLPIIPYSANKALVSLNLSTKTLKLSSITDHLINKSGTKIINQGILFKKIENLDQSQRKEYASKLNDFKTKVTEILEKKLVDFDQSEINKKLKNEKIDITLPGRTYFAGKIHPVSQVIDEVTSIFAEIGFSVEEGPDVESEYYNFSALNTPENHPARDMLDTFYLEHSKDLLLRTHTSPVQIRTMLKSKPPFKIIAPGRTYRCDSDQTHSPMFHQLEGLHIDKNINMGHLKGCLYYFVKKFFEVEKVKIRFRPSHFPFTEPSAEVDIGYKIQDGKIKIGEGNKWLEILGCGMVHPNVLKNVKVNPKQYQGYAFGVGLDRLAMLKYGINDIRAFFESDIRWLEFYGFDPLDIPTNYRGLSR